MRQVAAAPDAAGSPTESAPERPPRRRRRSLGLFGAVIAVPVLAATAWAASALISTGSPVAYRDGAPVSGVGVGAPVAGSVKLLTTSVPDPDGRPGRGGCAASARRAAWSACRSDGCTRASSACSVATARSRTTAASTSCVPAWSPVRASASRPTARATPTSRFTTTGIARQRRTRAGWRPASGTMMGGKVPGPPAPPLRQRRAVDFGLLGPNATRIAYRDTDATRTKATLGAEGGYLSRAPAAAGDAAARRHAPAPGRPLPGERCQRLHPGHDAGVARRRPRAVRARRPLRRTSARVVPWK